MSRAVMTHAQPPLSPTQMRRPRDAASPGGPGPSRAGSQGPPPPPDEALEAQTKPGPERRPSLVWHDPGRPMGVGKGASWRARQWAGGFMGTGVGGEWRAPPINPSSL